MKTLENNKDGRRIRRMRNFVAKNNKLKGGYHTSRKYVRSKEWKFSLSV